MPSNRIRVAMIGCGCVAGYGHAPAIAASDSFDCVAWVDIIKSRAEDFAARFGGGDVYTDYRAVLDRGDIDAVAILTMPTEHRRIALDALQAGKHVFTEKPIADSTAAGEDMVEAARQAGRKLFVGFLLRYTDAYVKMGEIIHAGLIGKPTVYRMIGFEHYLTDQTFYWRRAIDFMRNTSPGFDCGTHYVDLMRWYSGAEAVRVQGIGARVNPEVPEGCFDWEAFQVEFDDGSRGLYETGWGYTFPANRIHKEAIGPKGMVGVRIAELTEGAESGAETYYVPIGGEEQIISRSDWKGFDGEWEQFAKMIYEDLDAFPALEDALASIRIVEAAHRSAVEGNVIYLR